MPRPWWIGIFSALSFYRLRYYCDANKWRAGCSAAYNQLNVCDIGYSRPSFAGNSGIFKQRDADATFDVPGRGEPFFCGRNC